MSDARDISVDTWMREMSNKMGEQSAKLDAIDQKTDAIVAQTTKTNGRVGSLERWRAYVVGAITVLSTLIGWFVIYKSGH